VNERRRTAADFVAVVCALGHMGHPLASSLRTGADALKGSGASEVRAAVAATNVERDVSKNLDDLATRWDAPCLSSLAVAVRVMGPGAMSKYLEDVAAADAIRAMPPPAE